MNSLLAKLPLWKQVLYYGWCNCDVIYPTDIILEDIVKDKKSLQNTLYRLKKNGYIDDYLKYHNDILDAWYYEMRISPAGLKVIKEIEDGHIDQNKLDMQDNQPNKNVGLEVEVNGKVVFSISKEDAYKALEALKTISEVLKNATSKED